MHIFNKPHQYFLLLFSFITSIQIFAQTPELIVPAGHGDQVYLAKFSADGKFLFSVGTGSKGVKTWDTKTGRLLKNLLVDDFPASMQPSEDGKLLAIGTQKEVYFYAFPSYKLLHKSAHGAKDAVVDGNKLYMLYSESMNGFKVAVIDLQTFREKILYENDNSSAEIISLSPQRDQLFFASGFSVRILDIASGTVMQKSTNDPGKIFTGYIPTGGLLSFDDKGKNKSVPAVTDAVSFADIRSFDVKVPTSYRLQSQKNQVVFGANNQVFLSGDGVIIAADYSTGKKKREINTADEDIICMAVNGHMLVAGDKLKGTLKQYDINTGNLTRIYGEDVIAPIAWETSAGSTGIIMDGLFNSPCGYLSSGVNGRITAAAFQKEEKASVSIVGISADATITATYNQKQIQVYKAPVFDRPYLSFGVPDKQVASIGISPDNKQLVVAYKHYINVYDVATGNLVREISNDANNYENKKPLKNEYPDDDKSVCTFSADSRYVAVRVGGLSVFDLVQYTSVANLYDNRIEAIRFSADGKTLYYVRAQTYSESVMWGELDIVHPSPPKLTALNMNLDEVRVSDDDIQKVNASISPDLNLVAYLRNDEIWVYNRKEFVNTAFLKGHQSYVRQVRWLSNGILISSGNDNTIRFWNPQTGVELAKLVLFVNGGWVIVTPSGQFDASEDAMQKLYYVQGIETIPLDHLYETFYTPNLLLRILEHDVLPVPEVDVNKLAAPPKVKMVFDAARNLVVGDDVRKLDWTSENIAVQVTADCTEDVIDEIRLYLNGKLIENISRNLVVEADKTNSLSKSFTIRLTPGINNFRAVAINSQRTESAPDEADVTYTPQETRPAGNSDVTLHLVVVGINKYKNPRYDLNYANADASAFKDEIQKNANTIFTRTNLIFITDEQALKSNIEEALGKIVATAKPQDVFIFYYAGHGVMGEQNEKDFYIVPWDVTQLYGAEGALAQKGISAKSLQEFSKNIVAQKQLYIMDACQSAGALDAVAMRGAAEEKAIAQLARSTGSHWLMASGSDQFASEFAQLGHGVFTYVLLQGLNGAADNGDKRITVNELKAYLEAQVPDLAQKYRGTAQYPSSYGYGNDFPVMVIK